jgi:glycosyltransferase involved in cell wall biosynthesis
MKAPTEVLYSMTDTKPLSICYAVPGHHLLAEVGPTRNVLSVAEALSQVANVTLAFRKVVQPVESVPYTIVELDPEGEKPTSLVDDSAVRGTNIGDFLRYLLALKKFVAYQSARFDLVLEKSWLLSGYLTHAFRRRGVPGALVENVVRVHHEPWYDLRHLKTFLVHHLSQAIVRHYARKTPMIIAETAELKAAMMELWGIASKCVEVVELGVDRCLFHPMDQKVARRTLGIDNTVPVLLYVGVLDPCHNLGPVIEALNLLRPPDLQLHVVGDGRLRSAYAEMAHQGNAAVFFHGRVPHRAVPQFIAAADLCLAPYEPQTFFNGKVSFSTLKILEYLACARPVVSVPSGHILRLIHHGVDGFLFPNQMSCWSEFLRSFPAREQLREMAELGTDRRGVSASL